MSATADSPVAARPRLDTAGLAGLIRPHIAVLVLVITAAGYVLEAPVSWAALPWALVGTLLVAAAGCALNHFLERETDRLMARTANRPLVTGALSERQVSWGGGFVMLAGFALLLHGAGTAATLWQLLAIVLYLCVYTPLKKRTSVNTWVGALPGALPVIVGAAAAGGPTRVSWILFALVFLWQLPHFFAIASMYRDDYVSGGLRMLSGEDPEDALLRWQMPMQVMSVMLVSAFPVLLGLAGGVYGLVALLAGLVFLAAALAFRLRPDRAQARRVVLASVFYLPAVAATLVLDVACAEAGSGAAVACADCSADQPCDDCTGDGAACESCLATPGSAAAVLAAAADQAAAEQAAADDVDPGADEAETDDDAGTTTFTVAELLANAPPEIEDGTGLPNYGSLPEFSLIDDTAQPFGREQLLGQTWVVDFIFTNCAGPCPKMSQTYRQLQNEDLPARFLSVTVDPVRDDPQTLARYRDNMGGTKEDWRLLTGSHEALQGLADNGFKLPVNATPDEYLGMGPMFHSGKFALVDSAGRVRGYYNYNDALALDQLRADIRKLADADPDATPAGS